MKKITSIVILLTVSLSLLAVPARRGWVTRTLSDGSKIELQQQGDEYYHYWETRDGRLAELTVDGLFHVTDEPVPTLEQVAVRRASRAPQAVGTINLAPRGLVVLASYSDVPFVTENAHDAFDSLMNVSGYDYSYIYNGHTYTASGSSRDYFIAQSDSVYQPIFDVVGPVTLSHNRAYYGANKTSNGGSDTNPAQMIIDACQAVDSIVDFTQYDNDGNGAIDFVYVLYAGMGEADGGPAESIWPHNSSVAYKSTIYLDGKKLGNYACSGEINGYTGGRAGIGTICHEFGHVIGLPDYYDTNYSTNYIEGLTPNNWSIMDQGTYNNEGCTPPNYSIFDKYFFAWTTPRVLAKNSEINVSLGTSYHEGFQISGGTSLLPYTTTDTVYYIENRQLSGWDAHLPGHGLVVWRVVFNQPAWKNNTPNNVANKPRLTIIAADGSKMIGDLPNYINPSDHEGKSDPFPGTGNVTSWNSVSGFVFSDITEVNGVIRLKLNGGKTECTYEILSEHCEVPEDGVLAVGNTLSLLIIPEDGYRLDDAECWAVEMGSWNPLLEYGADFTYDANTHEFRVENVTDDIVIIVEAIEDSGAANESVLQSATGVQKELRNGQLVIIRGRKQYNAQGIHIQ